MEQGFQSRGWKGAALKGAEALEEQRRNGSSAYWIAQLYADYETRPSADNSMLSLKTDFQMDSLHSDQRFVELVRKVGLPHQ